MTDEQVRGLSRGGALVTALFALPWALTGAYGLAPHTATVVRWVSVVLVVGAVLCAVIVGRRGGPRALSAGWYRRFQWVGVVQSVVIAAAAVSLVASGNGTWVPAAVCLVVGLHFLPLAQIVGQPQYRWTGGLLCAIALLGGLSLTVLSTGSAHAVVGCGAAVVLWATSLHLSFRG